MASSSRPSISCTVPVAVVGVNNGTISTQASGSGVAGIRKVLVTPLTSHVHPRQSVIEKVLLKAASKTGPKKDKKDKTFTLRNLNKTKIASCDDLKSEIKRQLCDDLIDKEEFDVGYIPHKEGERVINIRSKEDIAEVWKEIAKYGDIKTRLWCDGLKVEGSKSLKGSKKRKRKLSDMDDDDDDFPGECSRKSAQEKREDKLKECLDDLSEKHGGNYTKMQYRIWSEMYANGMHTDLDSPPTNSMFKRAGPVTPSSKKKADSSSPEMAHALTQAACQVSAAITAAYSPKPTPISELSTRSSPAKVIDNRSKCYKLLSELHDLKLQGLLNEQDYTVERNAIMQLLKKLV